MDLAGKMERCFGHQYYVRLTHQSMIHFKQTVFFKAHCAET